MQNNIVSWIGGCLIAIGCAVVNPWLLVVVIGACLVWVAREEQP